MLAREDGYARDHAIEVQDVMNRLAVAPDRARFVDDVEVVDRREVREHVERRERDVGLYERLEMIAGAETPRRAVVTLAEGSPERVDGEALLGR